MKKLLIIGVVLISSNVYSTTELKGSPEELKQFLHPQKNIVTIEGKAVKTAYSDKAIISVVIKTEKKKLADAIEENSKLRGFITESLIQAGVKNNNINNSKFSSSPQFGWFGNKPDSFEVVNRMAISIFKEEHLKIIAQLTDKYKEIELSNTTFEHTKKKEYELKVKKQAIAEILKQRKVYEESLNLKLVPIGIQDSRINQRPTFASKDYGDTIMVTGSRLKRTSVSKTRQSDAISNPRTFDEVEYTATLWVQFKVVQKE